MFEYLKPTLILIIRSTVTVYFIAEQNKTQTFSEVHIGLHTERKYLVILLHTKLNQKCFKQAFGYHMLLDLFVWYI